MLKDDFDFYDGIFIHVYSAYIVSTYISRVYLCTNTNTKFVTEKRFILSVIFLYRNKLEIISSNLAYDWSR